MIGGGWNYSRFRRAGALDKPAMDER